jgi:hypothetical protein
MGERATTRCVGRARRRIVRLVLASLVVTVGVATGTTTAGAAEPSLLVDPSTDLVDRQTVTVDATGFTPLTSFGAAQCDPTADPDAGIDACDLSTSRLTETDESGAVHLTMPVRRIITVQGDEIDCALEPCTLGVATLDGTTPIDALAVAITFDPAVPPVPALSLALSVDAVSGSTASGTVTCNRDSTAFVDLFLAQEKGDHTTFASGATEEPVDCTTAPTAWTITFSEVRGRLTGGGASYQAFALAFDGFDDAADEVAGQVQVTGGRQLVVPVEHPGETVRVQILGVSEGPDGLQVDLEVTCDRAVPEAWVSVQVTQLAGLAEVAAVGSLPAGPCDGTSQVAVPLSGAFGVLVGGPARVQADVAAVDFTVPGEEFFDFASATGTTRLPGHPRIPVEELEPNPGSRITILEVSRAHVTGVIECEAPVQVELGAFVQQSRGRVPTDTGSFVQLACDGTTPFDVALEDPPLGGPGTALVFASAYVETEDGFELVWEDHQAAAVSIRG